MTPQDPARPAPVRLFGDVEIVPMRNRAFTLIELLIVCAILALLSALLLPVFTEARVKAKMTGDLSNLRQIGVARALYMIDHDGREVWSTIPLVQAGYLPKAMVRSPLDPSAIGMANVQRRQLERLDRPGTPSIETAYKDSYAALAMEMEPTCDVRDALREMPGFGWLINSNNGRPPPYHRVHWTNPPRSIWFVGPYHRLLPDGAVVTRRMGVMHSGPNRITFIPHAAFVDYFYTYEQFTEWWDEFRRR